MTCLRALDLVIAPLSATFIGSGIATGVRPTSSLQTRYTVRMLRVLVSFSSIVAVLALAGQVSPIEHPNLSGTWKLNVARSGPILPRGTEALTMKYEHRDPFIRYSETRTVFGKTTTATGKTNMIDGRLHVKHPAFGKTERSMQKWEGSTLVMHWELTDAAGVTYVSDIRTSLSADGKVLTMAEHYREPGMERIRDWVYEKQ